MMERLWKKYLRRKPYSLWSIITPLMWMLSIGYGLIQTLFRVFKSKEQMNLAMPVISVGNITVGGTGKTPLVATLARHLVSEKISVGIVSSGYGRGSSDNIILPGYKIAKMAAAEVGDEVLFLAGELPEVCFSIADSKSEAARLLAAEGLVDLIIVDDGFQHYKLHRDINIVTYDAALHLKQLKLLPHGMLREPLAQLKRADVIIITRSEFARDIATLKEKIKKINPTSDIYHAHFSIDSLVNSEHTISAKYLEDKSVFLFAGVGNFRSLEKQVTSLASDVDHAMELSDHQRYDNQLLRKIKTIADHFDSDLLVTTAKDWVKIKAFDFGREFYYLGQTVDLDPGEERLIDRLRDKLELRK